MNTTKILYLTDLTQILLTMLLSWQNEFWRSVDLDFKKVPQRRLCKIASSILKLCIFIKIEILGIYFKFQIRAQYQKWYLDIYILKYCFKRFLFDNLTLIFILNNLNFWVIVLCSPCWSELTMNSNLALDSLSSCLQLLDDGITSLCHQAWLCPSI